MTFTLLLQGNRTGAVRELDCAAMGIATVSVNVYDEKRSLILSYGTQCSNSRVTVSRLRPGSARTALFLAKGPGGALLLSAEREGVNITADQVTHLGPVLLCPPGGCGVLTKPAIVPSIPSRVLPAPGSVSARSDKPGQVNISWSPPSSSVEISGYRLYRNNEFLKTVTKGTSTTDAGLKDNPCYCYSVAALNSHGDSSAKSSQACTKTLVDAPSKESGNAWILGNGHFDGRQTSKRSPFSIAGHTGIVSFSTGGFSSYFVKSDGTVWSWGANQYGQLGDGTKATRSEIRQIKGLTNITDVSAGRFFAVALRSDGTVWSWGADNYGQLDEVPNKDLTRPAKIESLSCIESISAGSSHALALRSDRTAWSWGTKSFCTAGTDPSMIKGIDDVISVSGGLNHSAVLKSDGTVWGCGSGLSKYRSPDTFITRVEGIDNATAISTGGHHIVAIKNDGTVWTYGRNYNGLFGTGKTRPYREPMQAVGIEGVKAVAAGGNFTLALKSDGTLWSWGNNFSGQLGRAGPPLFPGQRGPSAPLMLPGQVPGFSGVISISASSGTTMVITAPGAATGSTPGKTDKSPTKAQSFVPGKTQKHIDRREPRRTASKAPGGITDIKKIIPLLDDHERRLEAAEALLDSEEVIGDLGGYENALKFVRALSSDSPEVRDAARFTLKKVRDPVIYDVIINEYLNLSSSNARIYLNAFMTNQASHFLNYQVEHGLDVMRTVKLWVKGLNHGHWRLRQASISAISNGYSAVNPSRRNEKAASLYLAAYTRAVVPPLLARLNDSDDKVRKSAVFAFNSITVIAAYEPIEEMLKDRSPEIRRYAASALSSMDSEEVIKQYLRKRSRQEKSTSGPNAQVQVETPARDITEYVETRKYDKLTFYSFKPELQPLKPYDISRDGRYLWIASSKGLIRFDTENGQWKLFAKAEGMPGDYISKVESWDGKLYAKVDKRLGSRSARTVGYFELDPVTLSWTKTKHTGRKYWQHSITAGDYTCVSYIGSPNRNKSNDFKGGNVSCQSRAGVLKAYFEKDGISNSYCYRLAYAGGRVWVSHWRLKRGLSAIDLGTDQVTVHYTSSNGTALGGRLLIGDRDYLWIGNNYGVTRLDTKTLSAVEYLPESYSSTAEKVSGMAVDEDSVWAAVSTTNRCDNTPINRNTCQSGIIRFKR